MIDLNHIWRNSVLYHDPDVYDKPVWMYEKLREITRAVPKVIPPI